MSRYCGDKDVTAVLEAGNHWKVNCLIRGHAAFNDDPIWTLENLEFLDNVFTAQPDTTDRSFAEKLADQLSSAPASIVQLAAELMWLMLLCPSNISPEKKRSTILNILSWGGVDATTASTWLSDKALSGIGSGGPGFNNHRPKELTFCINAMIAFRRLPDAEQKRLAEQPWNFAKWLQTVPDAQSRQFRHMLLYLLFPDQFERIFSAGDRRAVVEAFENIPRSQVSKLTAEDLDRKLSAIRNGLETSLGTSNLDFYRSPLVERWNANVATAAEAVTFEHVLSALKEIDETGIPPAARSTKYDLIYGTRRYPPKLVFSTAVKIATGKPLDHGDFGAGDDGQAFQTLRKLGFSIVPKRIIGDLVEQFLDQADKGEDLRTSSYSSEYRGLSIKVGFGQGSFSRVPWIAFLKDGQKVSEGIYPVLLYYREAHLLVLAYGISETNPPPQSWEGLGSLPTVEEYQRSKLDREPERYGASLVADAYEIPDGLDIDRLTERLDEMIEHYTKAVGAVAPSSQAEVNTEGSDYTRADALKDLFVDEELFDELTAQLGKNRNIILQGPPGVGKTFFADRLACAFVGARGSKRVRSVQFHASYSYEDFVQGYRPDGKGSFERRDGVFLRFCKEALADPGQPYVFIIDEINRANLSKVFGEFLMLIENDKRKESFAVELSYSSEADKPFYVPDNVYLIGLMNTADRSLALVDYALRRRFDFFDIKPGFDTAQFAELLQAKGIPVELIEHMRSSIRQLNEEITSDADLGRGFEIGHSYFCDLSKNDEAEDSYNRVINYKISPLLREYWYEGSKAADWRQRLLKS